MIPGSKRRAKGERHDGGFTLVEALAALALTGLIVFVLATVTAQWLPNWNRGFTRLQSADLLGIGLDHIVDDLSAAEFMTSNSQTNQLLFDGSEFSAVFVRASLDPNAPPHLEVVRLAETNYKDGTAMVRTRAPFVPTMTKAEKFDFVDPVVLIRAPYRVSFAYAGADRIWRDSWRDLPSLPAAVRITIRDVVTGQMLSASTAMLIHDDISPDCAQQSGAAGCNAQAPKPAAASLPTGGGL